MKILLALTLFVALVNAAENVYGFTRDKSADLASDENALAGQYGVDGPYDRKRRSTANVNALRGQYGMYNDNRERRSIIDDNVPVIHGEVEEEEIADEYHYSASDGRYDDLDRDFDVQDEADYDVGYDRKRRSVEIETDESTNRQRSQNFDGYLYGNYRQGRRYWI